MKYSVHKITITFFQDITLNTNNIVTAINLIKLRKLRVILALITDWIVLCNQELLVQVSKEGPNLRSHHARHHLSQNNRS